VAIYKQLEKKMEGLMDAYFTPSGKYIPELQPATVEEVEALIPEDIVLLDADGNEAADVPIDEDQIEVPHEDELGDE